MEWLVKGENGIKRSPLLSQDISRLQQLTDQTQHKTNHVCHQIHGKSQLTRFHIIIFLLTGWVNNFNTYCNRREIENRNGDVVGVYSYLESISERVSMCLFVNIFTKMLISSSIITLSKIFFKFEPFQILAILVVWGFLSFSVVKRTFLVLKFRFRLAEDDILSITSIGQNKINLAQNFEYQYEKIYCCLPTASFKS